MLLAYTNHALDHILRAVHDRHITREIVRLGSRSKDEVICSYSLDEIDKVARKNDPPSKKLSNAHYKMKEIEEVGFSRLGQHLQLITTGNGTAHDPRQAQVAVR